ncbi:MAG: low temperature requirement protein A, partial [Gordonia sp. (in: high G+C Gram-positive bacteria)]|uniref:low temperature requirement protein A n=1 Tax=Gordonia sp. (in: high G+C Gram-positive bacteria) TaxID=84139 RepID=UPI003C71F3C4
ASLAGMEMDLAFFIDVGLGLAICYVLWWSFFGVDDEQGRHALETLPVVQRNRPALLAYGYAFVPMLLGVLFTAAGLGMTISHSGSHASWPQAVALSGGVALYMMGQTLFRIVLRLPRPWTRLLAAAIAAFTIPIGVYGGVWMQLVSILIFVYAIIIADDVIGVRAGQHGQYL